MYRIIVTVLAALLPMAPAAAALQVFSCEPEWQSLAQELGGDRLEIYSATTAFQDPHHIEARPSLIAKARRADLVVCTGAELETGWLPQVLRQSGNRRVQPGMPGYFEAASAVTMKEVPTRVDRAEGDVHAAGNPHIQSDPRNIALVAAVLAQRLTELDPAHAADYRARHADFARRWQAATQRWTEQGARLRDVPVVFHHRSWVYLADWLGLRTVGLLEPKPGVPPSVAHLDELLTGLRAQPARMVVRAAYEDDRADRWLAERAHIPAVTLPYTVGGADGANDLFGLFDVTLARLTEAVP